MNIAQFKSAIDDTLKYPDNSFIDRVICTAVSSKDWGQRDLRHEMLLYLNTKRPNVYTKFRKLAVILLHTTRKRYFICKEIANGGGYLTSGYYFLAELKSELQSAGKNLQFTHVVIFDALTGKVQKVKGRTIKSIEHILDEEVPGWKLVKDIAA